MSKLEVDQAQLVSWGYVLAAVAVALCANALSTKWADQAHENVLNVWFWPMMLISPLVFVIFGLTASRVGLALGSASVDSLLTVATIAFGLVVFKEWRSVTMIQYAGMACVLGGIVLMHSNKVPAQ